MCIGMLNPSYLAYEVGRGIIVIQTTDLVCIQIGLENIQSALGIAFNRILINGKERDEYPTMLQQPLVN